MHPPRRAVMRQGVGTEGVQMRLVPRGHLQRCWVHLGEAVFVEPAAQGGLDAVARQKDGAAVGMAGGMPPGGIGSEVRRQVGHSAALSV